MSLNPNPPASRSRTILAYLGMIAGAVVVFLLIRSLGSELNAPAPSDPLRFGETENRQKVDSLLHVLLALGVVITAARVVGWCFRLFHQPPVIGEVVAGIMLGPSLLGRFWPETAAFLLPPSMAPFLQIIAQVGVILYMFLVGLEIDTSLLRRGSHATVAISHASILTPFILGALLALWIYPRLSTSDVPFTVFAMFLGVSMSVTAFPVLARILTDRGIHRSRLGVIALTCAAVDDATAWCLLAFVVSIVHSRVGGAVTTTLMTLGFIALMIFLARPLFRSISARVNREGRLSQDAIAFVIVALILSALTTESIGIHALFGAFLLGAIIPHDSVIARELKRRLEDVVVVLFLPAFFAFTGLRTQIGLVDGAEQWMFCGVITLVACIGKFGGSAVAGRLTGLGWREASALGILMNTRGLMELIVLNIGLDLRVLNPTLFAMLVLMAIITTVMTTPILHWLTRGHEMLAEPAAQTHPA